MKRTAKSLALAAGLTLSLLGGANAQSLTGNVNLWVYPLIADDAQHRALWDGLVADFNKTNPDVKVNVDIQPWSGRGEKLSAAIAGGSAPDLVYMIPDQIPQYVELGALQPLTISDADKADLLPAALDGSTYKGQVYMAPVLIAMDSPVYNKKLFDQVGATFPDTWDDLMALGPKFKAGGLHLIEYDGNLEMTLNSSFYPLLWQAGGHVFAPDGKTVAFNSPEGKKTLQFIVDLFKNGYADPDAATRPLNGGDRPINKQTAAIQPALDSYAIKDLAAAWGDANQVGVGKPFMDKIRAQWGGVGGFAMPVQANANPAAVAFAQFLMSPDAVKKLNLATGYFSTRKSLGSIHGDDPLLSAMEANLAYAVPGEPQPAARQIISILAPEIQAAILGQKSVDDALASAEAAANDAIATASN